MNRRHFVAAAAGTLYGSQLTSPRGLSALQVDDNSFEKGVSLIYSGNLDRVTVIETERQDQAQRWSDQQRDITLRLEQLSGMGVTSVSLTFPIFTDGWQSSTVFSDPEESPSEMQLTFIVQAAASLGISTMLRPLLDEEAIILTSNSQRWRGTIEPNNLERWFDSYTGVLRRYASVAQEPGCNWYVIGTEFGSLERHDHEWLQVVKAIDSDLGDYNVEIAYSQNWDKALEQSPPLWFAALDGIGIDAYFPMNDITGNDPPVQRVIDALSAYRYIPMGLKQRYPDISVLYTEVGVASMGRHPDGRTVFQEPWEWGGPDGGPPDMQVQATYTRAACHVYTELAASGLLDGMWFWRTGVWPLERPLRDNTHEFMEKPAEDIIRQCYTS